MQVEREAAEGGRKGEGGGWVDTSIGWRYFETLASIQYNTIHFINPPKKGYSGLIYNN